MKAPVCEVCLLSGMLCRSCNERLERGEVSETDIAVSRTVMKLSERTMSLRDVTIIRTAATKDLMVIVCGRGEAPRFIGTGGSNVRKLEREFGKQVKIVEETSDTGDFVRELVRPARIIRSGVLYRNGRERIKIVIGKGRANIPENDIREIVDILLGKEIEIFYE